MLASADAVGVVGGHGLGKHTTVLAAAVAAVSLAVKAWRTCKSAQVADDQLAQSGDNQETRLQAQAALVTMWGEKGTLVVSNGSTGPVTVYWSAR